MSKIMKYATFILLGVLLGVVYTYISVVTGYTYVNFFMFGGESWALWTFIMVFTFSITIVSQLFGIGKPLRVFLINFFLWSVLFSFVFQGRAFDYPIPYGFKYGEVNKLVLFYIMLPMLLGSLALVIKNKYFKILILILILIGGLNNENFNEKLHERNKLLLQQEDQKYKEIITKSLGDKLKQKIIGVKIERYYTGYYLVQVNLPEKRLMWFSYNMKENTLELSTTDNQIIDKIKKYTEIDTANNLEAGSSVRMPQFHYGKGNSQLGKVVLYLDKEITISKLLLKQDEQNWSQTIIRRD